MKPATLRAQSVLLALALAAALPAPAQQPTARPADPQASATATGVTPTLEDLLKKIGGKASSQARFVEKKYLAVLDAPVESAGVLRYRAPARLEKNTERPIRESMMIDGDLLVMERDGKRRTIPAAQFPGITALVGGLRDTLGGNAEALRRVFKVVIQGDAAQWQMDLLPSDTASAQLVSRITLRGRDDQVLEVETLQADGDRSVMVLSPE
jgi:hypothetical protein